MMHKLITFACLLHVAFAAPQFVTFDDGKIGVRFGGYHASAGLGGLLTGNAAHGGLSASAGTPWGQNAAAGLGGNLNGSPSGVAYAGAQAIPSVGASAVLGGTAGQGGFVGSEAHSNKKVVSKTVTSENVDNTHYVDTVTSGPLPEIAPPAAYVPPDNTNAIQKVKPPKKYTLIRRDHASSSNANANIVHSKHLIKTVNRNPLPPPPPIAAGPVASGEVSHEANLHVHSGLVGNILNIPIGILRSLQESIGGLHVDKTVSISHSR